MCGLELDVMGEASNVYNRRTAGVNYEWQKWKKKNLYELGVENLREFRIQL